VSPNRKVCFFGRVKIKSYQCTPHSSINPLATPQDKKEIGRPSGANMSPEPFLSNNGHAPPTWGPAGWCFLHACTFGYPQRNPSVEQRRGAFRLVASLPYVLPCSSCREHALAYIANRDTGILSARSPSLDTRDSFARWMFNFHEAVNARVGHPANVDFEAVRAKYEHMVRESCKNGDGVCTLDTTAHRGQSQWRGRRRIDTAPRGARHLSIVFLCGVLLTILFAIAASPSRGRVNGSPTNGALIATG
jgi:hypothetical protein